MSNQYIISLRLIMLHINCILILKVTYIHKKYTYTQTHIHTQENTKFGQPCEYLESVITK